MASYGIWRLHSPEWGEPEELVDGQALYISPNVEDFETMIVHGTGINLDTNHKCPFCRCCLAINAAQCRVPHGWGGFLRYCPNALCPGRDLQGTMVIKLDGAVGWIERTEVQEAIHEDDLHYVRRMLAWIHREEQEQHGRIITVPPPGVDLVDWWYAQMAKQFTRDAPIPRPRRPLIERLWGWLWRTVGVLVGTAVLAHYLLPGGVHGAVLAAIHGWRWLVTQAAWAQRSAVVAIGYGMLARIPAYADGAVLGVLLVPMAVYLRQHRWSRALRAAAVAILWMAATIRG